MQDQDGQVPPCCVQLAPGELPKPGVDTCAIPRLDPMAAAALKLRYTLTHLHELGAADALMRAEPPTARMLRFLARVNAEITNMHEERRKE